MALVSAERFDRIITKNYVDFSENVRGPVAELLNSEPNLRKAIERWLNEMLKRHGGTAVKQSVHSRMDEISFSVNIAKQAQGMHAKLPQGAQKKLSVEMICIAMEMLLENAGFHIESHTLNYSYQIYTEEEEEEVAEEEEAEEDEEEEIPAEVLQIPEGPPEMSFDGPEEEEVSEAIVADEIYRNSRGVERQVTDVSDETVSWLVTKGSGNKANKTGASGESSLGEFQKWTKEKVTQT